MRAAGPGCEQTNCERMTYYPLAQRQGGLVARGPGGPHGTRGSHSA